MKWSTVFMWSVVTMGILILKSIIAPTVRRRRYKLRSQLNHCMPAPTVHSTNLLGTSVLKESIKATKEDRGPQFVVETMNRIGENIHTVRVPVFNYEMIVTRDPRNVQAIFATKHEDCDISPLRAEAFMPFLGEGIFTSQGERWKHSRSLVRPQFAHAQINNMAMVEHHVLVLLDRLRERIVDDGCGWTEKLDLQPLFFNFTIDVSTEFLYGRSVNSLSALEPRSRSFAIDGARFSRNFDEVKHLVDRRGALQKFYWLMPTRHMNRISAQIHRDVDQLIAERLAGKREKSDTDNKFVLLDELAKLTDDRLEMRRETLHILMAGRDPSGSLLGWIFYFLARHRTVLDKLKGVIAADTSLANPETITFAAVRRCHYLQWVINEVIRITAIIPMNERTALRDTILPTGGGEDGSAPILIMKGTQILVPQYALQHRPDIWGADVEQFRPEQWDGRKPGWEWIPFGAGQRKCLGQQFALVETGYTITRLLQNFDMVENMEVGNGNIKLHTAIENRSGTGVQVRLRQVL